MSYPNLSTLTPQKHLPGAFFQTPAPKNVSSTSLSSPKPAPAPVERPSPAFLPKLPPAASKSQSQTLSIEERAASTINDTLVQESRYPDLDSYLSRKENVDRLGSSFGWLTVPSQKVSLLITTSPPRRHGRPSKK